MGLKWIIRHRDTLEVVCETHERSKVDLVNHVKYEAVEVYETPYVQTGEEGRELW